VAARDLSLSIVMFETSDIVDLLFYFPLGLIIKTLDVRDRGIPMFFLYIC